jgi:hypothetical protein
MAGSKRKIAKLVLVYETKDSCSESRTDSAGRFRGIGVKILYCSQIEKNPHNHHFSFCSGTSTEGKTT